MTGGKQETAVGLPTGNVAGTEPTAWAPLSISHKNCYGCSGGRCYFNIRRKKHVITGTGIEEQ